MFRPVFCVQFLLWIYQKPFMLLFLLQMLRFVVVVCVVLSLFLKNKENVFIKLFVWWSYLISLNGNIHVYVCIHYPDRTVMCTEIFCWQGKQILQTPQYTISWKSWFVPLRKNNHNATLFWLQCHRRTLICLWQTDYKEIYKKNSLKVH